LLALALADRVLRAPDIRHLHAHFAHDTTTITWLAARMTGLTFSFTAHAKDIYAHRMNPRGLLRRKLRAATFVVTCTEANRLHLETLADGTPVHLLYHGLNDDFVRFDDSDVEIASTEGEFRILGVGRLVRKKGFDVFVAACGALDRSGLDFSAAIAGEDDDVGEGGSVGEQLRRQIETLRLTERVALLGRTGQRELYGHYRAADVCCLPCRVLDNGDRDGIPNVLLEAMSCGVPVVSTPVSGIPELIDDGVNGLLVPPDDPEALASAVRKLHDDPALARRLAEAGRRTVRQKFDGNGSARRLAELFEGVLR
jgi:glycosyltransferase involved in cell wall biosynthesis